VSAAERSCKDGITDNIGDTDIIDGSLMLHGRRKPFMIDWSKGSRVWESEEGSEVGTNLPNFVVCL